MLKHRSCIVTLLCLGTALSQTLLKRNFDVAKPIENEYLVLLKEAGAHVDKVRYVDDIVASLQKISSEFKVIDKFLALRSPVLLVSGSEEIMRQAENLAEVQVIEANIKRKMTQQCTETFAGVRDYDLSRITSHEMPDYPYAYYYHKHSWGSGVRAYVLDTGIRTTHTDFEGERAVFGTNTIGGGNDDMNSHGTHCAGKITGRTAGISKTTLTVAVKVLNDEGEGSVSSVIAGINWAIQDLANEGGRGVISMSLVSDPSDILDSAVGDAVVANIPVVVAAGNYNLNSCNYSPSRSSRVMTVGATDVNDNLADFSNWGSCIDILAPGVNIFGPGHGCDACTQGKSGTSAAASLVTGYVASYLSENSSASPAEVVAYILTIASSGYINLRGTLGTPNLLLYANCE